MRHRMTTKVITREEVHRHRYPTDAWVVVDGRVYDVTEFLPSHPGGLAVMEDRLGSDISLLLRSPEFHRHSSTAFEVLEQYCIGRLADSKVCILSRTCTVSSMR